MFALPGAKLGWIAVTGDAKPTQAAMKSLEMMSDTFLPVNEDIQAAVSRLFRRGKSAVRNTLHTATRARHQCEEAIAAISEIHWQVPEGGFYGALRLPDGVEDEQAALELLEKGFLAHPGYFYDLEGSWLVFNFVQTSATLKRFFASVRLL